MDNSYDMTKASTIFTHFFSILLTTEKIIDHYLRSKVVHQSKDDISPFIKSILDLLEHFFDQSKVILDGQNLLYHHILLSYLQIGNIIQKVLVSDIDIRIVHRSLLQSPHPKRLS